MFPNYKKIINKDIRSSNKFSSLLFDKADVGFLFPSTKGGRKEQINEVDWWGGGVRDDELLRIKLQGCFQGRAVVGRELI